MAVTRKCRSGVGRLGVVGGLVGLFAALLTVATPTAASAHDGYHCRENPNLGTFHFHHDDSEEGYWLYIVHVHWTREAFFEAEQNRRGHVNGSESPATVTFTTSHAETKSSTTTINVVNEVTREWVKGLSSRHSVGIMHATTESTTTTTQISVAVQNLPMGRVQGQYGVFGYEVNFTMDKFKVNEGRCWYYGSNREVTGQVMTADQYWVTSHWPNINRNGIINGENPQDVIHPGTVVSIYGQYFVPKDKVIVSQNGANYTIEEGSDWWWDTDQQINAKLPPGVTTGWADVKVQGENGRISNIRRIFIQP